MKIVLTLILVWLNIAVFAQLPYTENTFNFQKISNIIYGTATNYAGFDDTLLLDIYKPLNDDNCKRPLLILVHGGAWIAGSKADPGIVAIAQQMSRKGYVVAAINYRLGTHKAKNYTMYWACSNTFSQPCGYIADSSEVYRANFRGMQDAKGAIRFMKARNLFDSTDINNVFIAGESAGAFISMTTAFTDNENEKPADCFEIADAPTPDADLINCLPKNYSLKRPDLGSIDGNLHTGIYDASVKGVGSFYGGLLNLDIVDQTAQMPVVYLFHQGSDVVVHYKKGALLGRTSYECYAAAGNICQPYYFYPQAFGGESVKNYFEDSLNTEVIYKADIISNYSYGNNCFSNGHAIDNTNLRVQNMADLFAEKIEKSGNNPETNCTNTSIKKSVLLKFELFPNPINGNSFTIKSNKVFNDLIIYNSQGQQVHFQKVNNNFQNIQFKEKLPSGIYIIMLKSNENSTYQKIIIN